MNQDQIKEKLLEIDGDVADFSLIFSGKQSKKVDGLYHPDNHEIVIHNKNFEEDNSLMYTAIHEFAHHVQFTRFAKETTPRAHHTVLFWDIFHKLLKTAEEKGIYINIYETDPRFKDLTDQIKENYLAKNGEIMKEFGKLLIQALDLCQQKHAIFEDYVDRALGMNRTTAKSAMQMFARDVDPAIGFDNMKVVASIKEPKQRQEAVQAFKEGQSQNEVRQAIKESKPEPKMTVKKLESQKKRIQKSIEDMQQRLVDVEDRIVAMMAAEEDE
ncbi:MAG: hypothetical protein PQJ60_05670 [Spirochaetales bacterium]|nr:hypothetical protein [Spirochaetales bacterium]